MKYLICLLILITCNTVNSAEFKFKPGDCFSYTDFEKTKDIKYIIGKIEYFHFGTFDYIGTLYLKKNGKKSKIVKFKFEMPFLKQDKYEKINCPSG